MKKADVGYSIDKSQDGSYGYGQLKINLLVRNPFYSDDRYEVGCSVEYQSNHDSLLDWYAAYFHNNNTKTLEDLKAASDVATKVFAGVYMEDMQAVLQALRKFDRFVYDKRVSDYVKVEDLVPATFFAYFDNYKTTGNCTVRVMARGDEEAKRLITQDMARNGYHGALRDWILADMPVRKSYESAPEVPELDTFFAPVQEATEVALV